MPKTKIITGQHVSAGQSERARDLRRNMTPAETSLWQCLRAGRLCGYHFRRQQVIDRFIVDFYCHRAGLVVEVDGSVHEKQEEYDRERDFYLRSRGLRVMRFTNTDVNRQLETVLAAILEACAEAGKEERDVV
jgi:very-short-patch-repair endonuclease